MKRILHGVNLALLADNELAHVEDMLEEELRRIREERDKRSTFLLPIRSKQRWTVLNN